GDDGEMPIGGGQPQVDAEWKLLTCPERGQVVRAQPLYRELRLAGNAGTLQAQGDIGHRRRTAEPGGNAHDRGAFMRRLERAAASPLPAAARGGDETEVGGLPPDHVRAGV